MYFCFFTNSDEIELQFLKKLIILLSKSKYKLLSMLKQFSNPN